MLNLYDRRHSHVKSKEPLNTSGGIRKVLIFLEPSSMSLMLSICVYILILLIQLSPFISHFVGDFSINQLQGTWIYTVGHKVNTLLALDSVGKTSLFIVWLIVGVVVFVFLRYLAKNMGQLIIGIEEADGKYIVPKGASKYGALFQFLESIVFRVVTLIIIVFYVRFLVHLYAEWQHLQKPLHSLSLNYLAGKAALFLFVFVLLQILVFLMRLFLLRSRVFQS